jgi:hypothetical protein
MRHLFPFFLRLFFAFLAAKCLAILFSLQGLGSLIGLTLLFLGNVYLFDYLDFRSRTTWRRSQAVRQPRSTQSFPPPPPEQPANT